MLKIKDSVAVITGGASGLGLAIAEYWVAQGGKVVLGDVAESALEEARSNLQGEVATVVCNVTSETDCARLAETAIEKFGQINLVAPFAGIIMDGLMLATDRETGKVKKKMSLGAISKGGRYQSDRCVPDGPRNVEQMINNDCKGLVCLVSSTGSLGTAGQINYSSTKAAMSVMPKVLTAEFFRRGFANTN